MIDIISFLDKAASIENLDKLKKEVENFYSLVGKKSTRDNSINYRFNGTKHTIKKSFLLGEIKQIIETKTLERTHYYINRLIKSLIEKKTNKINDLNLNRWKEYDDIITDSLWLIDKRDKSGVHKADYWGNFIPQIPNQFLRRYTKKGDWVLDPFLGSGTTLIECQRLGRNGLGIDLNAKAVSSTKELLKKEENKFQSKSIVVEGNSRTFNLKSMIKKNQLSAFQFLFLHPPYWDIIKFSKNKNDLSNAKSVEDFLKMFGEVLDNTLPHLQKGRYFAVVISDKYSSGEWIPLGFYTMQEVLKRSCKLKSTIVKNFDQTLGKRNQKELWRYRALAGGFYIFKHEYIFLFQK
jgi:DNA modification methylase